MVAGLLFLGLIMLASALQGTEHELAKQLQTDMVGTNGYLPWIGAIMAIGAIGYIPGMKTPSRTLLALLATVVIVRNGGVWANAQTALQGVSSAGPAPSIAPPAGTSSSSSGGSSSGSSSSSSDSTVSDLETAAEIAAVIAL